MYQTRFNAYCMRIGKILTGQNQISYHVGWVECKQEVLKILNRRNNGNINDLPEDRIKEIEKL